MYSRISSPEPLSNDLSELSWNGQVDELIHRINACKNRKDAILTMALAAKLGFLEEYRDNKWQPAKGLRGKKAAPIIEAFHAKPSRSATRGRVSEVLERLGPPPADMPPEIRRLVIDHLLEERKKSA